MKKLILIMLMILVSINITNANYTRNIDDDFKIDKLQEKIWKIIEKKENPELLKSKIISLIVTKLMKLTWKTEIEDDIDNINFESYKEYFLISMYKYLSGTSVMNYLNSEVSVLENDNFRVLVTLPNIDIDDNSVYYTSDSWSKIKYLESFKISSDENIEDFINTEILEKKYIWKCKAYVSPSNSISFTENTSYAIWWYWDYAPYVEENTPHIYDCGYYWAQRSIKYFEKKWEYLFFINAWQDYNWVDYSLIETK